MPSTSVAFACGVMLLVLAVSPVPGHATDWSGVQLAWRNDPRPAADAPLPVDPSASRRTTRRALRRSLRRGELEPTAGRPDAAVNDAEVSVPPLAEAAPEPVSIEPAATPRTIVHRDQPYGDQPGQRFDLHLPDGCSGGRLPLVVWIHGPDWRTGSKVDCPVTWLVEQGFAVASIDYRPSDAAVFPAQLDDCRAAVGAICAEATTWGIDPSRICVAGIGGGGHLAALVAFAPADQGPIREASTDDATMAADAVAAAAVFDAPSHLPSLGAAHDRAGSAASRLVGGPLPEFREAAQKASPLVHVTPDDPPTLIVHGSRGDSVSAEQGVRLDAALHASGVDSALVVLDAAAGGLVPARGTPAGGALVEFLDRTLGSGTARLEN
jgi:acetyl esterase/lipase